MANKRMRCSARTNEKIAEIPADIHQELEGLRHAAHPGGPAPHKWQPWEDRVLLEYWGIYGIGKKRIAKLLGVGSDAARERYATLKKL